MENTGRFDLPLIMPSQAQKHVTHNEALTLVDGLMHLVVKTFGETSPPVSAQIDDAFVIGASPTGAWFGEGGNLAFNTDAGWRFANPVRGIVALNAATGRMVIFDQGVWKPLGDVLDIATLPMLGINTSADTTNRLAVRSNAALLTAVNVGDGGNGDLQVKLNKETQGDTGSLLYQTGFSGRAEIGLSGDDDLSVKVSPDGSVWTEALRIDRTSGAVTLRANSVANAALANMATVRIKGRATAGTGAPEDLNGTQATALLDVFATSAKGLAPASGGGTVNFLRADGTWAAPVGGGAAAWGGITGTLSAQTDLQTALNGKQAAGSYAAAVHGHAQADITGLITALAGKLAASAVSSFGLTLVDDADAATARGTLGLGTLATQSGTFSGASSGTNTGDQTITLTGNVTGSGTGSFATTIAAGVVSNAMLATVAAATFKGRTTAGSGAPEDLTVTQVTALLNAFTAALKGLVPASGGGTVNYLRADGTWAAPSGSGPSVDPLDLAATGVAAPATGTVRLFRKDRGGRQMPAFMGPTGLDATVQPFIATNKIARWNASGNGTATPIVDGFAAAFTTLGTATARNVAATDFITRLRRFGHVSAATAGALCGHFATVAQWTIGTGTGLGGFYYNCRFVPSDAAAVSGARMFIGLRNAVAAPTNVEPSSGQINMVGVGQISTSNNLHICYGGSAAQTPIDLGASFPAGSLSSAAYELELFASPGTQTIGYKVTRLDNNTVASGTLSGTVGTQVPAATTFLAHTAWRCNNAGALACGLDVVQVYLETDN